MLSAFRQLLKKLKQEVSVSSTFENIASTLLQTKNNMNVSYSTAEPTFSQKNNESKEIAKSSPLCTEPEILNMAVRNINRNECRSALNSRSMSRSKSPMILTKKSSKPSVILSGPSYNNVEESGTSIDFDTIRGVVLAASNASLFDNVDAELSSQKLSNTITAFQFSKSTLAGKHRKLNEAQGIQIQTIPPIRFTKRRDRSSRGKSDNIVSKAMPVLEYTDSANCNHFTTINLRSKNPTTSNLSPNSNPRPISSLRATKVAKNETLQINSMLLEDRRR